MKSKWFRLAIIIVLGAIGLVLAERFGPGGVQRRGMRAADEFRQQIAPRIAADSRFAKVDMSVMTHPSLRVYGEVPDLKASEDLKALCQAPTNAPFSVSVRVELTSASTKPVRE